MDKRSRINIWVFSDPHFAHDMLVERGIREEGYEDKIIQDIQSKVKSTDILICLGDFSFYRHLYWIKQLCAYTPCTKWLIRGNHDKKSFTWYLENGWDFVGDKMQLNLYGYRLSFTHVPINFTNDVGVGDCDFNIHGHLHSDDHRACHWRSYQNILVTEKVQSLKSLIDSHIKLFQ